MKLLVLGPRGQLGSDLMRAPLPDEGGTERAALDRSELDVTDDDAVRRVLSALSFDILVNCTGFRSTAEAERDPARAFALNAHAPSSLARACAAAGARLVHLSTDYVFDGRAERPYREEDCPGPLSVYGASKAVGEGLARAAHDDVLILRTASLFGAAGAGGNFVETILARARAGEPVRVVDDVTMSPTATEDLAWMILALLERGAPAGVYHAVNSGSATWHAFAERVLERAGVGARVEPVASEELGGTVERPRFSVLDNSRLAGLIGPIPHWTDALERYLRRTGALAVER